MEADRRIFIGGSLAIAAFGGAPGCSAETETAMYGLIGKFTAAEGKRDELIGHLLEGLRDMPGCLSYIVASDPVAPETIWVTEAWTDEDSHKASLSLPSVQDAIRKARPIIAGMESIAQTQPVGGHGLSSVG
ncbi:MAG TPA: putative quinol monooxygenase [Hyphomonas sp.]|nr:putative quinol monooxygenase [Hyphomonas sp.]HRK68450.1 putative quinol monooxygenase [Hyphomonas sp.]